MGGSETGDSVIFVVKATDAGRLMASEAVRAALPEGVEVKLQAKRILHATLVLAGTADWQRTTQVARETASLIRLPRFELVLDILAGFGGPKGILALTCSTIPPEWTALRKQLSQIPRRLGRNVEGGSKPHLTMAYGVQARPPTRLPEPVVWAVDEFLLVRSPHGKAVHELLGQWALR